MKKIGASLLVLAAILLLSACGNHHSATTNNSRAKVSTSSTSAKTSQSKSESTAASSSNQSTQTRQSAAQVLQALNKSAKSAIAAKTVGTFSVADGHYPTAGYTGNQSNYSLYYGSATTAGSLARHAISRATLMVQRQTYSSASAAQAAINYQQPATGLPKVNLGHQMSGYAEGAAGSTYYTWYEGRWSVVLRASNQANEDGLAASKQAVALLAEQMLPIPAGHGAVQLYATTQSSRSNLVSWRESNVVYRVSGVNYLTTLQAATSLQ